MKIVPKINEKTGFIQYVDEKTGIQAMFKPQWCVYDEGDCYYLSEEEYQEIGDYIHEKCLDYTAKIQKEIVAVVLGRRTV